MVKKRLLVIEDEITVAKQLKWGLGKAYDITLSADVDQARKLLASDAFAVATLDLGLPPHPDTPEEGFGLLEELARLSVHTKAIVITGNAEEQNAIKAIGLGAADFCAKPIDLKLLTIILERTFKLHALETANRLLQQQNLRDGSFCGMLGLSPCMQDLFKRIRQVSATDYPVLISGESGTGKEMVAHAIHSLSAKSDKPLVIINCGAIPENLIESELFGHEKGAFTGASGRKIGRLEAADKGTVFLDEIGELPLSLQVKLLRFIQEGTIERVGSTQTMRLDVRLMAATNIDLEAAVKAGQFREDLFYRLNVVPLKVPGLVDRKEDILILAHHFLHQEARQLGREGVSLAPASVAALSAYAWPGNVRELQNRIRRALGLSLERILHPADLGFESTLAKGNDTKLLTLKAARKVAETDAIQKALVLTGNNISQAAKLLAVSRPTLHDLINKHGIKT